MTGEVAVGKELPALSAHLREFIEKQHVFFTATAAAGTRINISPRSTDWFRVAGDNAAVYLDRTGSGNETAAHTRADGRITIMFCAFEGPPLILRLYGEGRVIHRGSDEYAGLLAGLFEGEEPAGARQMVRIDFDLVKTSCGYGVPMMDYSEERTQLDRWTASKGDEGIVQYWHEKNVVSMDGLPTGMFEAAAE
jgi:hypothetical protein